MDDKRDEKIDAAMVELATQRYANIIESVADLVTLGKLVIEQTKVEIDDVGGHSFRLSQKIRVGVKPHPTCDSCCHKQSCDIYEVVSEDCENALGFYCRDHWEKKDEKIT